MSLKELEQRLTNLGERALREQILELSEISYHMKDLDAASAKSVALSALSLIENVLGLEGLPEEERPTLSLEEARSQKAALLCTLSYCLWRLGNFNDAILRAEESHKLYAELSDQPGQASALLNLGSAHWNLANYAKALECYQTSATLYAEAKDKRGEANALSNVGNVYWILADYPKALKAYQESLLIREEIGDRRGQAISMNNVGNVYHILKEYDQAVACREKSLALWRQLENRRGEATSLVNIGIIYEALLQPARALDMFQQAFEIYETLGDRWGEGETLKNIARMRAALNEPECAIELYKQSLKKCADIGNIVGQVNGLIGLSETLLKLERKSEAQESLLRAIDVAEQAGLKREEYEALESLSRFYAAQGDYQRAFEAHQKFHRLKEEALGEEQRKHLANLRALFEVESARKEAEIERLRNVELASALAELKAAQSELVQREKLAALGELVAKVAHEMQNPLNFVNNFAQLSIDMIDETLAAMPPKGAERETFGEVLSALRRNAEKTLLHGERASNIVRAMLEHSRLSAGERIPTDINKLLAESLNYAVESFRRQEKGFELSASLNLSDQLPLLTVAPQDLFRAFLNIIQNAIQSAWQKAAQCGGKALPQILIATALEERRARISIRDNGLGIAKDIQDKIFQPFFTTKPRGEGSGLGLAICHDIIKAHGGTIEAHSQENEFAEFIIYLPLG